VTQADSYYLDAWGVPKYVMDKDHKRMNFVRQVFPSFLLAAVVVGGSATIASGQKYTCLTGSDFYATHTRDYIVSIVTSTDTAMANTRNLYQLPAAAASKVTIVSNSTTCHKAGAAYNAAENATPPISRTLAVIRIGSTRFVVLDPNQMAGEFQVTVIFDSKWNYLASFIG
jgi:hypothetical protein